MSEQIVLPPRAATLIKRMEDAPDFGYDDEAVELHQILEPRGLRWKWSKDFYKPHVIVYRLD